MVGAAPDVSDKVLRELSFRMGVTTVMLSTLDLDYILYVILSGITSGDGLGHNRAFLLLDDEHGRDLRVTLALGPTSLAEAERIWNAIEREKLNFTDLLPRYQAFRADARAQVLTRKMTTFKLPLNRLDEIAAPVEILGRAGEATLSGALARSLVNRRSFCSNTVTLSQEIGGSGGELLVLRNVAIVPLAVECRLIGAIVVDNTFSGHEIDEDGLRALHAMGNLAALAIDRARLHARTVAMAEVDGLTGVYNRRYYGDALEAALTQAVRAGTDLSIVVFDIDHFKRYNDEQGHLVGDEVLKDVARLLVENVRSSDIVARYGGEEFVLLLKETNGAAAAQVAHKLCTAVREAPLASGRLRGLTLSAGVAHADPEHDDAASLFARADAALYVAKNSGRDRVELAPEVVSA